MTQAVIPSHGSDGGKDVAWCFVKELFGHKKRNILMCLVFVSSVSLFLLRFFPCRDEKPLPYGVLYAKAIGDVAGSVLAR